MSLSLGQAASWKGTTLSLPSPATPEIPLFSFFFHLLDCILLKYDSGHPLPAWESCANWILSCPLEAETLESCQKGVEAILEDARDSPM